MLDVERRTFSSSYGLGGLGDPPLFMKGVNKSIGTGRNVVVLCSLEISRMVWRKRNCSAIGSLLIIAAACTIFLAAWYSPSAVTTLARRLRSASACLAMARLL